MVELFSSIDYDKFFDEIWEEVVDLEHEVNNNNSSKEEIDSEDYTKSFWWIKLEYDDEYTMDEKKYGEKLTASKGVANLKNWVTAKYLEKEKKYGPKKTEKWHKETFYSQKVAPWKRLNIPWRHEAKGGTIRDKDGYICVACNYLPQKSLIMTTLWPGKVYDTGWMTWNWIDIYTNR